jgi:hypothetical protein
VARKAENTGSRLLGLLLLCLVGCWLYYHGRSLTCCCLLIVWDKIEKQRRKSVYLWEGRLVMAATQASMDMLVGLRRRVCGQTKQARSKEVNG